MTSEPTIAEQAGFSAEAIQRLHGVQLMGFEGVSARLAKRLGEADVRTLADLVTCPESVLLSIPYVTRHVLSSLRDRITCFAASDEREGTIGERMGFRPDLLPQNVSIPIAYLPNLPRRVVESLALSGIDSIDKLLSCREQEITVIYNLGSASFQRIIRSLDRFASGECSSAAFQPLPSSGARVMSLKGRALVALLIADPSLAEKMSLREIAANVDLSHERVRQVLDKLGVPRRKKSL